MERARGTSRVVALVVALTLSVAAMALPAAAAGKAKTHNLKGKLEGDANGKVTMKVKVKNGEPKKVKKLKGKNVDSICREEDNSEVISEFEGPEKTFKFPKLEVFSSPEGIPKIALSDPPLHADIFFSNKGKKAEGFFGLFFQMSGLGETGSADCNANGSFTATKKK